MAVSAETKGGYYFPERYLCQWFASRGENVNVYCFVPPCGTQELKRSYELLVASLNIDTVVLVDGGTDSLLRGDEEDLGTPEEDMTSIAAVDQLKVPTKILACLGFGIDAHHGVCHAHVLATIAEQTKKGGYWGAVSLLSSMDEVKLFVKAADYVFRRMPQSMSIVVSSIMSALDGQFGDYHVTDRTEGSKLFINPLMCLYWFFDLHSVADSVLYIDKLRLAEDSTDAVNAIKCYPRTPKSIRRRQQIPF